MSLADSKALPETGKQKHVHRPNFDDVLQDTIRDTLIDVFGGKSTATIIRTLERVHSLKLDEVPEKSQQFRAAMQGILGTGHQIIEDMILENFSSKLGKKYEYMNDYTLGDYINKLKKSDYQMAT
jgi:hypothetical protein